jgi:hypothetical protein
MLNGSVQPIVIVCRIKRAKERSEWDDPYASAPVRYNGSIGMIRGKRDPIQSV